MKDNLSIISHCSIKNNTIYLNGKKIVTKENNLSCDEFLKQVYKEHVNDYTKFFKMDKISKLTFLAAEFLCNQTRVLPDNKDDIAIVLSNKSASLDTDRKHQDTIDDKENYFPSPAIFVYTLPNIGIGEISIRHQIQGENAFFVFEKFNAKILIQYSTALINAQKCTHAICGWVDVDQDQYEAFMYLVSKDGIMKCTEENINTLYQKDKWNY